MNSMLIRPGLFLLALVCFLLPFIELSCNHQAYVKLSGVDLAFGTRIDSSDLEQDFKVQMRNELNNMGDEQKAADKKNDTDKIEMEPLVLGAFICLSLAMLASLFLRKRASGLIAGILSIATIVLLFAYQSKKIEETQHDVLIDMSVRFLYGFWVTLGISLLAGIISIMYAWKRPQIEAADMTAAVPPAAHKGDVLPGTTRAPDED